MDRKSVGLVGAVASIVILYFASGSPIPLYSMYQGELGLTQGQLSLTSVCYLIGTVVSLLFFPRLSDHLGRRPVTVLILAVSFIGCFVFANLTSPEMLMAGRLIQGIVSGLGSSTVAAYIVDLCADLPKWVGPAITSSAPTLGLSTGAFVSGGVIQYTGVTAPMYFTCVMGVIVVIALTVACGVETVERKPGLMASVRPRIQIPASAKRMFLASAFIFVGTWAVGGFSQAYSSTIVQEYFGSHNAFLAAAVFTSLLLPNAVGGFFAKRFDTRTAQRYGMAGFSVFIVVMYLSLAADNLALFLIASIIAGLSQGVAFTGSVTGILAQTGIRERAGVFSTIYLTSYGGAAVPNLIVGMVSGPYSVLEILSWYTVLTVAMSVMLMAVTVRKYDIPSGKGVMPV